MAFDNIHLEKGMYHEAGRSFTQVLEQLDPSEGYRGTPLENTDAFQRQLKRFGIRVKGAGSDTVEKFFSTFESAVLFPEFLARAVRQGMDEANILPAITATVTRIDAMDYRSIYSVPEEADRSLAYVAEGASIPATAIRTREHLVRLYKRGRMLVASYEALRFQKLDLFSVMLRQIGAQIQAMHLEDAVNVLRNGDGNDNAAAVFTAGTSPISGEQGTLTYAQLVEFWAQFAPYEMNTMLVSNATMVRLLKLTELQNPLTGLNFQGTGKFETPLGASLLRTQAMADGCILAFDRRYALEMVQAGDVGVEYDKLIDRQRGHHVHLRLRQDLHGGGEGARGMMGMSEEITAAAVRILGTEEELLPALCTAAEAGLRARLRRDVDPEKECRECFVMAAALVAASTLLSAQAQGVTDFDAGQVSLRLKDPGDSMVRGALYMLTPWMEPDTCFLGVRA